MGSGGGPVGRDNVALVEVPIGDVLAALGKANVGNRHTAALGDECVDGLTSGIQYATPENRRTVELPGGSRGFPAVERSQGPGPTPPSTDSDTFDHPTRRHRAPDRDLVAVS